MNQNMQHRVITERETRQLIIVCRQFKLDMLKWIHSRYSSYYMPEEKGKKELSLEEIYEYVEAFLDFDFPPNIVHPLNDYVDNHPEISGPHRKMILRWKERVKGVFKVIKREGLILHTHNLVDDLSYDIILNSLEAGSLSPNIYLYSRIIPLYSYWLSSGSEQVIESTDEKKVYGFAAELAMRDPRSLFRNPKFLALAREKDLINHTEFVTYFGDVWIHGSPEDVLDKYKQFFNLLTQKQQEQQKDQVLSSVLPELSFPRAEKYKNFGIFSDPNSGFHVLIDFDKFLELFAHPEMISDEVYRKRFIGYLYNESVPPALFEILAQKFPEATNSLFQTILNKPDFNYPKDGIDLLKQYKSAFYSFANLPSTIILPPKLREGYLSFHKKDM